jgi:hypothetical protein
MMKTKTELTDVVIIGATPGGVASAVAAARNGVRVVMVERHNHIGGMSASGLGKSDVEERSVVGGIFAEFVERVRQHYADTYGEDSEDYALCREGYYYEPSVAESIFKEMLQGAGDVTVMTGWWLDSAQTDDADRVRSVRLRAVGEREWSLELRAAVFIDATYEGDLIAASGARYRLGREARDEYGEPHAGLIYYDYENGQILPGSTGEADDRLPAYTYRLCLTKRAEKGIPLQGPPDGYERQRYLPYLQDLEAGRLSAPAVFKEGWGYYPEHFDTLVRALSVTDMPNGTIDANINPRPLAFPFPGENIGYVEGDAALRLEIEARHKSITLGLLWFLQHDPVVPSEHQAMARQYYLPAEEFMDNGNFAWQLYIREARRLVGRYVLTEHDVAMTRESPQVPSFDDAIAVGEFPIDSFPVQKKRSVGDIVLEGYLGMLADITRPYPIPYRVMLPERIEGLIVPVALSASHVAFSSVRMEPTWMALGQAAGTAAALSVKSGSLPSGLPVAILQAELTKQGQVMDPLVNEVAAVG